MPLSQNEVNEKYARLQTPLENSGILTSQEAMQLIQELSGIDKGMLEEASRAYMKSIGQEGRLDWGLLDVDGGI